MADFQPVDESLKRDELNQLAEAEGLKGFKTYQNKALVAEAINRVRGGEDVSTVDDELTVKAPAKEEAKAPEASEDVNGAVNLGHPRHFDETGNPIYRRDEV